jgi:hypothetical protein
VQVQLAIGYHNYNCKDKEVEQDKVDACCFAVAVVVVAAAVVVVVVVAAAAAAVVVVVVAAAGDIAAGVVEDVVDDVELAGPNERQLLCSHLLQLSWQEIAEIQRREFAPTKPTFPTF